jgi:hypothetical protein
MAGFVSQLKVEFKKNISIFIALFYLLFSGYFVIQQEYINGEFYYYFFRSSLFEVFSNYFDVSFSKTWYASVNKIIFPLSFWFITVSFFLLNSILKKSSFNFINALHTFRYGLIFHFYVILSTYATEIVPGISIMPGNFPPGELIDWYSTFFVGALLTLYYLFCFKIIKELINGEIEWFKWTLVFSPVVHVYLSPSFIHLYSFSIALIITIILVGRDSSTIKNKWVKVLITPKFGIFLISILSLFFRYKYAVFFTSTGESLLIFNADGETYYNAAKSFFEGNIRGNNFYQTPLYSLYLSVFFHLFGVEPSSVFYSQALLGSFVPLIIYKILSNLKYSYAGLIAAFLVATDPLCIHYSISVNRSSPLLVTLPLIILFCVNLEKNISAIKLLLFGSLMVATFYIGPETLPVLLGIGSYIGYLFIKKPSNFKERASVIASFLIGVAIISAPLNLIYYDAYGELILMGRDSHADHSSTFFYRKSPPIKEMIEMGFNPINKPQYSLDLFFQKPLIIFKLIFEKLIIDLPGFLLDPENVYFAPLHLSMESYYGAHIQFYIYFFFILGIIYFIKDSKVSISFKTIILGSILFQAIGTSIIIFGTNRFRAPIVPLNLVFVGYGIWKLVFDQFQSNLIKEKTNVSSSFFKICLMIRNNNKSLLGVCFAFLIGLISLSLSFNYDLFKSNYKISNWVTIKGVNSIANTFVLKLNSENAAIIVNSKVENKKKLKVSFPICNFLIPGESPFFVYGTRDKFLIQPKRVPRGCFEINTEIPFVKSSEIFYIYFYSSENGNFDLTNGNNYLIKFYEQDVPVRFFQKINLKNRLTFSEVNRNYQKYSKGGLAIGKPIIK